MSAECSPTASACFCVCSTDASSASSSVEEVGRPLGSRPGPLPWEASSGREALEEPSGSDSATRGDLSRDLFRDCIFRASSTHGLRWANPNVTTPPHWQCQVRPSFGAPSGLQFQVGTFVRHSVFSLVNPTAQWPLNAGEECSDQARVSFSAPKRD